MNVGRLPLVALWLLVLSCGSQPGAPLVQPQRYVVDRVLDTATVSEQVMAATIAPYRDQLTDIMNRELAVVATPLVKGRPESSLGNWTADLLKQAASDLFPDTQISFAVQNYGGLRIGEIGAGPLTVSEIYELMPFDNELVVMALTGRQLREFVEHTLNDGGWPVSEGLSVVQDAGGMHLRVAGADLVEQQTYYVALPDYVANGGNDASMLATLPQLHSGRLIRDVLIEYAGRSTGPISVVPDGSRIKLN